MFLFFSYFPFNSSPVFSISSSTLNPIILSFSILHLPLFLSLPSLFSLSSLFPPTSHPLSIHCPPLNCSFSFPSFPCDSILHSLVSLPLRPSLFYILPSHSLPQSPLPTIIYSFLPTPSSLPHLPFPPPPFPALPSLSS